MGESHHSLYVRLGQANPGQALDLTEPERAELWQVCDYIDECWDDNPEDRRTARRWRDRIATPADRRK